MFKKLFVILAIIFSTMTLHALPAQAVNDPLVFTGDGDPIPRSLYDQVQREIQAAADSAEAELSTSVSARGDHSTNPRNCASRMQLRGDGWGEQSPTIRTPYRFTQKYTHQYAYSTLIGYYCPNGSHPNKFYPVKLSHCYTWLTDSGESPPYWWYIDTKFNAYAYESQGGRNVNPSSFYVSDDESRQNCATQHLSSGVSGWLRTGDDHDPRWRQNITVRLRGLNDVDFSMRGLNDRPYNKIDPSTMSRLRDWRNP